MRNNKEEIIKLQGDRLADSLGLEPGTIFELDELTRIASANSFDVISIRGKMVKVTFSAKTLADLILIKRQRQKNR